MNLRPSTTARRLGAMGLSVKPMPVGLEGGSISSSSSSDNGEEAHGMRDDHDDVGVKVGAGMTIGGEARAGESFHHDHSAEVEVEEDAWSADDEALLLQLMAEEAEAEKMSRS